MAKFEKSVLIERPAETVWKFIADFSNVMKSTPHAPDLRQVSSGAFGLGTTFSGKDGKVTLELRITEFSPNQRLVAEFVKPGFVKGTTDVYRLEEIDEKTRLTETWDTRLNGLYRLLGPFFAPRTKRDVTARLDNMKRTLELERVP